MTTEERDSALSLLYATVLIDNRVVKVEVDHFFAAIEDFLKIIKHMSTLEAKALISNWFVQNYKHIMTEMKSSRRESFLFSHVENLKNFTHKHDVFTMMKEISISDDEYHEVEQEFLDKVSKIWNLPLD